MATLVTNDQERWDAFVAAHGGNFLQSWGWGAFQEALGRKALRYRVDHDDAGAGPHPIAQMLLVTLPLPLGRRFAYAPRGPVVARDADGEKVRRRLDAALVALKKHAFDHGLAFARTEWPLPEGVGAIGAADFSARGMVRTGHVQPDATTLVDLTRGEDEMLAAMHQKTRYNIRVAEKHGVTVAESRDMAAFLDLLAATAERDGFHTHARDYYEKMFATLAGAENGMRVRLWLAFIGDRPAAAAMTAEFGGTVTYLHGASRHEDRKAMAPNLLHWGIIRDAKCRGFATYDFWGVAPNDDASHPWAGITRFKMGFGGPRVTYPGAWDLPTQPFWYGLYRLAKKARR